MDFPITYNKKSMALRIKFGKHYKVLQCPFATWWKARKFFKRPKFRFYFGPTCRVYGKRQSKFGEYLDYNQKGLWPMASLDYLKWRTPKWFPIHIMSWDIGWKDKWNTPRYERPGFFVIYFGRDYYTCWQFSMVVKAPEVYCCNDCTYPDQQDNYWESILWYLYYAHEYNKTIDVNTRNGLRTYEDTTCDIVKARNTMNINHWSTTKNIDINDIDILSWGFEQLNMGLWQNKEFLYLDIKSDQLFNIIDISKYNFHNNMLCSDIDVAIKLKNDSDDKTIFETCKYIRIVIDKDSENIYELIRLYFNNYDKKISDILPFVDSEKNIKFIYKDNIDLGGSFKDEFLNKNGIKEIRNQNE